MAAIRPQDADRYCAAPPEGVRLFLVYGNDPGAVTERARQIERVAILRGQGNVTRFGSDEISADPGRIADEAFSAQLFGGEPVISLRVLDGRHAVLGAVQPVLDTPPQSAWLIVEAGELKRDSALLRAFSVSVSAVAIPTYHLEGRELLSFIQNAAADAGMVIEPGAVALLAEQMGDDRLAARTELEKLFLYTGDSGPVTSADVEAIVGNTGEVRTDHIIDAALLGDAELLEAGLDRLRAEGGSAASLAAQALRHLIQLWTMRVGVESGASVSAALERARPPIFPRRRSAVEAALRRWSTADLANARQHINDAVVATRRQPNLEMATVSAALHEISQRAHRRGATAP